MCTCLSSIFSMLCLIFQLKENREHRDLNPGLVGEKRERYLCAMPPPLLPSYNFSWKWQSCFKQLYFYFYLSITNDQFDTFWYSSIRQDPYKLIKIKHKPLPNPLSLAILNSIRLLFKKPSTVTVVICPALLSSIAFIELITFKIKSMQSKQWNEWTWKLLDS